MLPVATINFVAQNGEKGTFTGGVSCISLPQLFKNQGEGINVQTNTDQKQKCDTTGGSSGITDSCKATTRDGITQSGGELRK